MLYFAASLQCCIYICIYILLHKYIHILAALMEQAHIFIHKMKACTWERGAEGAAALPADKGEV